MNGQLHGWYLVNITALLAGATDEWELVWFDGES